MHICVASNTNTTTPDTLAAMMCNVAHTTDKASTVGHTMCNDGGAGDDSERTAHAAVYKYGDSLVDKAARIKGVKRTWAVMGVDEKHMRFTTKRIRTDGSAHALIFDTARVPIYVVARRRTVGECESSS